MLDEAPDNTASTAAARPQWSSRFMFLLSALGATIGLGNLWRFPYLAFKYGGGAFLVPYLLSLFLLGAPLLTLELSMGQILQRGAMGSFQRIGRRTAAVGVMHLVTCIAITSYYVPILAWTTFYLGASFQSPLPWAEDEGKPPGTDKRSAPQAYFDDVVTHTVAPNNADGGIAPLLVVCLFVGWLLIFLSVIKGPQSLGLVSAVSAPLPLLLLIALFFRAITLEGAAQGILYYISPNWSKLLNIEVWLAASTQIFFSLSLAVGVMPAYASYNDKKQDIVKNNLILAFCNSAVSLFCGFVVFGILGHMSHERGVPIEEVATSGPGLAFVVFPEALALMGDSGPVWSVCFFLTLFFLALASAFGLLEAIRTSICDIFPAAKPQWVAAGLCSAGFFIGLAFVSDIGVHILEVVDHYSAGYLLTFGGLAEVLVMGWVRVRRHELLEGDNSENDCESGKLDNSHHGDSDASASDDNANKPAGDMRPRENVVGAADGTRFLSAGATGSGAFCGSCFSSCTNILVRWEEKISGDAQVHITGLEFIRQGANAISSLHIPLLWNFLLRLLAPIVISSMIVAAFVNDITSPFNSLPPGYQATGWIMVIVSIALSVAAVIWPIPIVLQRDMSEHKPSLNESNSRSGVDLDTDCSDNKSSSSEY